MIDQFLSQSAFVLFPGCRESAPRASRTGALAPPQRRGGLDRYALAIDGRGSIQAGIFYVPQSKPDVGQVVWQLCLKMGILGRN